MFDLQKHLSLSPAELEQIDLGCREMLKGAADLHVHGSPSFYKRIDSDRGLAINAKQAGHGGIVLKAHEGDTSARAALVSELLDFNVRGGVVLNKYAGGFNSEAVLASAGLGGKIVWMPTVHADRHMYYLKVKEKKGFIDGYMPNSCGGLSILDDYGKVIFEVKEVLKVIAGKNMVLATGHLSPQEIKILVPEALDAGVKKILINHPDLVISGLTIEEQVELARQGAFLEKCFLTVTGAWNFPRQDMVDSIKAVGVEQCVMATDLGQAENPYPAKGLELFACMLADYGFSTEEIRLMAVKNPAGLLES